MDAGIGGIIGAPIIGIGSIIGNIFLAKSRKAAKREKKKYWKVYLEH